MQINLPVKHLTINLGVGTQVNLPAKYLVKLIIKQFLSEIFPAIQLRDGTYKVLIHQTKNSKLRININFDQFKYEIPGWTGCWETPIRK